MRLVLWGISPILKNKLEKRDYLIDMKYVVGYIEDIYNYKIDTYNDKPVYRPNELCKHLNDFDYILITSDSDKTEILERAVAMPFLCGRIIPFEFLFSVWDEQYSEAYCKQFTGNIKLIKNWYITDGHRNILLSVKKEFGNDFSFRVVYGGIGVTRKKVGVRVVNVQNGIEEFAGAVDIDDEVSIELNNALSFYRIEVCGLGKCFIAMSIKKNKRFSNEVSNRLLRSRFESECSRLNDVTWHDLDYSFLQEFADYDNYTIIDVGANIGQSSLTFLRQTGMDVVAIEPHPMYGAVLDLIKNQYDDRFQYISCGAGAESGELTFYMPRFEENTTQEAAFNKNKVIKVCEKEFNIQINEYNEEEYISKYNVPVIKLDSILDSINKPILFVKIDAESYEKEVIYGMCQLIQIYHPIILLEYSDVESMQEVVSIVNEESNYIKLHWDYNYNRFVEENICNSINYFLLPKDNPAFIIDDNGRIIFNDRKK